MYEIEYLAFHQVFIPVGQYDFIRKTTLCQGIAISCTNSSGTNDNNLSGLN
jgi:hypothetical protein